MKKQNLIKKMMITMVVFTISIQPISASENNLNEFTQKFNEFLKSFKDNVKDCLLYTSPSPRDTG